MVRSFEPIGDRNAEVLILGSMPGRASLAAGQYYAHPQNAFWRILSRLLQCDPASPYPARIKALKSARIALWDVLQSCEREGSLDSMIERETQVANVSRGLPPSPERLAGVLQRRHGGGLLQEARSGDARRRSDCLRSPAVHEPGERVALLRAEAPGLASRSRAPGAG